MTIATPLSMSASAPAQRYLVTVCQHCSCLRNGADQVLAQFQAHQSERLQVSGCECQGQCGSGPTVRVVPGDIWYCRVQPEDVDRIVQAHLQGKGPVQSHLNPRIHTPAAAYAQLAAQYQAFMHSSQAD